MAETLQGLRDVYRVLAAYAEENGRPPFSANGADEALYELKDYVHKVTLYQRVQPYDPVTWPPADVGVFDLPYARVDNGAAKWDDAARRLVNADVEYANLPRALQRSSPDYAVVAELKGCSRGGRWVVFCNGEALWVSEENLFFRAPLGCAREVLSRAEPAPVTPPRAVVSAGRQYEARHYQMERLWDFLMSYAEAHGSTPYAPRGADYAFYQLRPYVPSADVFDAVYSSLENGVAYFDEGPHCVRNADFDYINSPLKLSNASPPSIRPDLLPVVVLADKWGVYDKNARWLLFGDMLICQVWRGSLHAEDPLGKGKWDVKVGSIFLDR